MTKDKVVKAARKATKVTEMKSVVESTPYPVIGYTIWWTISKTERTADELQAVVDATFGRSYMPDSHSMRRVCRTALEAVEKQGIITRIPSEDDSKVAYTLHRKDVDKVNIDLDLEKEQTIVFNKADDSLEIKADFKRNEIMELIAKYSTVFTEDDIRIVVLRYLKTVGAVTMRESGGIYFVIDIEVRNKLRDFIVGNGGSFYALGIPDAEVDKATMHEIVKAELDRDLQLAAEELKQFLGDDTDHKRIGAFENRIGQFNMIKAKAALYKDLLASDIEELAKQIDMVTGEVTAALSGEIAVYPQAVNFPLHSRVKYSGKAEKRNGSDGVVVGYQNLADKHYCRILFDSKKVASIVDSALKLA